ncbi:MAG: CgeB family protein [Myxococcaceae bacterium]
MHVVIFCHSLRSDWNHASAHFLRGYTTELMARGHRVDVYEPANAWSLQNLISEHGYEPLALFHAAYPHLAPRSYELDTLDLDRALDGADLVLVHEWNDRALVRRIGEHRMRSGRYRLLFHDTHHRAATAPEEVSGDMLQHFDGVLGVGEVIREIYLRRGWARRAFTWHEAADVRVFRPLDRSVQEGEVVWVGNWGDEERGAELAEFLLEPVEWLGLRARAYGVRYPRAARDALQAAGVSYRGWLPNFEVPKVFARFAVTLHVPRRPYVQLLRGIPTIRPFEAMACGIPLVCAPWHDTEGLFEAGADYLVAHSGGEMRRQLYNVVNDPALSSELAAHGLKTIQSRHTCAHRVDELLTIYRALTG